uniref:peptidylprolyl isomerase n=1 Tax=Aceria tosichella TaxID=561515 RepID=A0A6G1SBM1_9ACAR
MTRVKMLVKFNLVILALFFCVVIVRSDLNSGTEDDDDSLDSNTGGAKMEYKDEILNSLPKMPEEKPKETATTGKLHIGIKKRAENCERQAQKGDSLHMHYKGTLKEGGTEFDNSYTRGQPLVFTLGIGQVIKGWDQGLLGICAGEKRKLVIPSHLAYGENGSPPTIPPGATLVFEVEAVKVEPGNRRVDL